MKTLQMPVGISPLAAQEGYIRVQRPWAWSSAAAEARLGGFGGFGRSTVLLLPENQYLVPVLYCTVLVPYGTVYMDMKNENSRES